MPLKPKKSKRSKASTSGVMGASNNPFSNTRTVTLRYNDVQQYAPTLGSIVTNVYRLNSCFDPDQTGIGHQPRGFDEYMALYERFEVLSTEAKATFASRDQQYASIAAISVQSGVSTPSAVTDYMEGANSRYRLLGAENSTHGSGSLSLKVDNAKYLGLKKNDSDLQGTSGTNPGSVAYLHVAVQPIQSVTPDPIDVIMDLSMKVKFSHPKKLIQS